MSLATRCPACSTAFRVVQDQLKVSEGWVRCGHCGEAFNALEGLFDMERDSEAMPLDDQDSTGDPAHAPTMPMPLEERPDYRAAEHRAPEPSPSPLPFPAVKSSIVFDNLPERRPVGPLEHGAHVPAATDMVAGDSRGEDVAVDDPGAQPDFLRRAQRAAVWRKPVVRFVLFVACVAMAAVLALQVTLHQRDLLAAHRPDWAPALTALCTRLGCTIEPLRDIGAIVVDSSDLEATGSASQFRFGAVLRNLSLVTVATPSLDLSLTDESGKVVLRKTLMPEDFGPSVPTTLKAGSEAQLKALLDVGPLRVVGYTVLAYYP